MRCCCCNVMWLLFPAFASEPYTSQRGTHLLQAQLSAPSRAARQQPATRARLHWVLARSALPCGQRDTTASRHTACIIDGVCAHVRPGGLSSMSSCCSWSRMRWAAQLQHDCRGMCGAASSCSFPAVRPRNYPLPLAQPPNSRQVPCTSSPGTQLPSRLRVQLTAPTHELPNC